MDRKKGEIPFRAVTLYVLKSKICQEHTQFWEAALGTARILMGGLIFGPGVWGGQWSRILFPAPSKLQPRYLTSFHKTFSPNGREKERNKEKKKT